MQSSTWLILGKIQAGSLLDAHAALKRSLAQPEDEFTRNSSIQCFEFTLELVWKTLKRVLEVYGVGVSNARETFRQALAIKLVDKPETWFQYIELCNKSTHTYAEPTAKEIYGHLPKFSAEVDELIRRLRALK